MSYKTIVGLEIHAQLNSKTKAFCTCKNESGLEPNTSTCPGCLGMPGALPVLNQEVVDLAIKAGLAFNCKINRESTFERKKYFYPDLTKGYQITQQKTPICEEGYIFIENSEGEDKKVRIQRIQIEEDTGKSIHNNNGFAYMDFNRAGAPLVEIVTHPDLNSGKEARDFLIKLKNTLVYLDINDGKMEDGSLRCDVNVNIVDEESGKASSIIEVKNINSFSAVEKTIDYEIERQKRLLEEGKIEVRSTRRWDDSSSKTILMREKYSPDDYKYSFDGNIPNLIVDDELINNIKENMPELIEEKEIRFMNQYNLSEYDSEILSSDKELAEYFEKVAKRINNYELISNFMINDLLRRLNDEEIHISELKFTIDEFVELLELLENKKINNNTAKKVFRLMFEDGINPTEYIKENNLIQMDDTDAMEGFVDEVLKENPDTIEQYLSGKDRVLGFLVGQVMKKSKGKANPQVVNKLLLEKIKNQ